MTSDIEMRDSNDPASTDSDSSELTVESDQASEYELEEILSERFKHGQREYLVKWANYDLIRSTWEPRTSFDQAETFSEWNAKKREIKAGRIPAFDVAKLKKDKRAAKIAARKARLELRRARQREQAHRFLTLDSSDSASDPEPGTVDTQTEGTLPESNRPEGGPISSVAPDPLFVPLHSPTMEPTMTKSTQAQPSPHQNNARSNTANPSLPIAEPQSSIAESSPHTIRTLAPKAQGTTRQTATDQQGQKKSRSSQYTTNLPKAPVSEPSSFRIVQTARPVRRMVSRWDQRYSEARVPDASQLELLEPSKFPRRPGEGHAGPTSTKSSPKDPPATSDTNQQSSTEKAVDTGPSHYSEEQRRAESQRRSVSPGPYRRRESYPRSYDPYRPGISRSGSLYTPLDLRQRSPELDQRIDSSRTIALPSDSRRASAPSNGNPPMPLASSHPPALSVEDQIARMPVGRPLSGAILTRNGYFFNRDEVLAHVYFGVQKKYIGAVRLCGQTPAAKMNLLATKGPGQTFEMWFQHTCTLDEYRALCRMVENRVWCNAWMEGFSDTNEELFTMAESLRVQNRIAVYYPEDPTGNTWLAYSTRSPQFEFLDKMNLEIPGGVPIRLAVRNPLPPVPVLTAQAIARSIAPPSTDQQPRPSAHSDFQHVQRFSEPDSHLHSQRARLINTTGSDNLPNSGRHTNVQELRDQQTQLFKDQDPAHIAPATKSPHQTEMATSIPAENSFPSADPRLRRPTSSSSGVALSHKETPLQEQDVSQNVLQNGGWESVSNFTEDTSTGVDYGSSPVDMALDEPDIVERPENLTDGQSVQIKEPALAVDTLLDFFKSNLRITFQELATLQDSSTAGIFYLHFPNSSETLDPEFQLLDHWLNHHSVIVLSNRNPSDWEKFKKNSKNGGVAIFHESFHGFDTLQPRIWEALWYPTNFWTIRISNPLEFPDLRYCEPGVHIQRLFSYGGAFLLTEDVFHDLQRAAIIFCWFSSYQKSAPGANKLVFRPDLLQYLSQRLADPKREVENDGLLITIIAWIKKINSVDSAHPYFNSKSLDPRYLDQANNNVLCLPIPGYGTRSETQSPDIPRGLTQEERNADHLVETFSGWAISNATRLRRSVVVTNCKNPSMLARWKNWGHVSVLQVSDFMRSWKINEELYLEKLQHGNISSQSGGPNSPLVTPHTPRPRTPRTPRESQDIRDHRGHGGRRHASTGDSHASWNGNWRAPDKIQYPAGYK